jgi:hypothetical protein
VGEADLERRPGTLAREVTLTIRELWWRAVNLIFNEDLVTRAKPLTENLSGVVECSCSLQSWLGRRRPNQAGTNTAGIELTPTR